MPAPDAHGRVALLLCESLLHALVEERVLSRDKALEVIDVVVEVTREAAEEHPLSPQAAAAAELIGRIATSFAARR